METAITPAGRMETSFHFRLPDWPARRLVREAVLSYNLRRTVDEMIDPETAPWPQVRGVILAFLRHQQTSYDSQLRERCEHDQAFRDELASEVAKAAYAKYRWLGKNDPRPFPKATTAETSGERVFDLISKALADDHTLRDHTMSAIRDLRRAGKSTENQEQLLARVNVRIQQAYKILTEQKVVPDSDYTGKSMCYPWRHPPEQVGDYFFWTDRRPVPNRIKYQNFRCPRCHAVVAMYKQPVDFGQGCRMLVYSCFCRSYSVAMPPDRFRLINPVTPEVWADICASFDSPEAKALTI
jgi:hypothetical protein